MLFQRATLLSEVFEDDDWRRHVGCSDDFELAALLDEECEDTNYEFMQLYKLRVFYPKQADWKSGNLPRMFDAMREAQAAAEPNTPRATRWSISRKQYEHDIAEARVAGAALSQQEATGKEGKQAEEHGPSVSRADYNAVVADLQTTRRSLARARVLIDELEAEVRELRAASCENLQPA
jgi:hypothetical protein